MYEERDSFITIHPAGRDVKTGKISKHNSHKKANKCTNAKLIFFLYLSPPCRGGA